LEVIKEKITLGIKHIDETVKQFSEEMRQKKQYIHEHRAGMDEADMVAADQSVTRMAFTGGAAVERKRKLIKLIQSPYFGRIDFKTKKEVSPVYIGIHTFADIEKRVNLI